jgi:acyl carrier protein
MGSSSAGEQLAAQDEPLFGGAAAFRPPGTRQQGVLCSLFAEALEVTRVGLDDNFFELGGQSLNGIRLINLINKALGLDLSMVELFDFPTVAELDEHLRGKA